MFDGGKMEVDYMSECEYCKTRNNYEIHGKEFNLLPTAGYKNDRKYSSWIMKNKMDRAAGIMISTDNSNAVYFEINYCPMCGRNIRRKIYEKD